MNEAVFLFPFFIKFWLWLAVFTVLYVVIAYLAYKKRKAEDVAKPYVFKSYYYAIISCVTFAVCAIIPIAFDILLIPMIVVAAVAFLAFELITNRGFKKFGKSLIKCALTIAASILLIGILDNGWGFGIGRRVPDAEDVESVTIENMEMVMGVEIDYDGVEFFEKDAIEAVISAHTKAADRACDESEFPGILKDYYSYDAYNWDRYYGYDYARTTTITYKLKNGSSITREYKFNEEEREIISSAALMSIDYAKNETKSFVQSNRTYPDEWDFYITVHDAIQKDEYTIATRIKGLPGDDWMLVSEEEYNTFVKEIADAIGKDILDRTYEQVMQPYGYCGKIDYFAFYEYDENILATLEKYNMHITPISEAVKKLDDIPIRTVSFNDDDRFFSDSVQSDRQLELVKQLLTVVYPAVHNRPSSYYERLEEYSIRIQGDSFDLFIPDEYSDIARELFDMAFESPPARVD
ncbi:MAG: APC family permease [Oscillospiraceae bacterium]|nr:APC family permease [Oscillospiraceae bacterium]